MPLHRLGTYKFSNGHHRYKPLKNDQTDPVKNDEMDQFKKEIDAKIENITKEIDKKIDNIKARAHVLLFSNKREGEYFILQSGETFFKFFVDGIVKILNKTKDLTIILDKTSKTKIPDLNSATKINSNSFKVEKNDKIFLTGSKNKSVVLELLIEYNV